MSRVSQRLKKGKAIVGVVGDSLVQELVSPVRSSGSVNDKRWVTTSSVGCRATAPGSPPVPNEIMQPTEERDSELSKKRDFDPRVSAPHSSSEVGPELQAAGSWLDPNNLPLRLAFAGPCSAVSGQPHFAGSLRLTHQQPEYIWGAPIPSTRDHLPSEASGLRFSAVARGPDSTAPLAHPAPLVTPNPKLQARAKNAAAAGVARPRRSRVASPQAVLSPELLRARQLFQSLGTGTPVSSVVKSLAVVTEQAPQHPMYIEEGSAMNDSASDQALSPGNDQFDAFDIQELDESRGTSCVDHSFYGLPAAASPYLDTKSYDERAAASVYGGFIEGSVASGTLAVSATGTRTAAVHAATRIARGLPGTSAVLVGTPVQETERSLPAHSRLVRLRSRVLSDTTMEASPGSKMSTMSASLASVPMVDAMQRSRSHRSNLCDAAGASPGASSPGPDTPYSAHREAGHRRRRASSDAIQLSVCSPPLPVVLLAAAAAVAGPSAASHLEGSPLSCAPAVSSGVADGNALVDPVWGSLGRRSAPFGACTDDDAGGDEGVFHEPVQKRLAFDGFLDLRGSPTLAADSALYGRWSTVPPVGGIRDPGMAQNECMPPPPQRSPIAYKRARRLAALSPAPVLPLAAPSVSHSGAPRPVGSPSPASATVTPPPHQQQMRRRRGSLSSGPWSSVSCSGSCAYSEAVAEQSLGASHRGSTQHRSCSPFSVDSSSFVVGVSFADAVLSSTPAQGLGSGANMDTPPSPAVVDSVRSPKPSVAATPTFDLVAAPITGAVLWAPSCSPCSMLSMDDDDVHTDSNSLTGYSLL